MTDLEKIIEGCRKNNPAAIKKLYDYFSPRLFGICLRYARTNFEAEDILQDGFVKIIKNFRSFEGNQKNFEAWLRKIILFTAIDHFKKNLPLRQQIDISELTDENIAILPCKVEADLNSEDLAAIVNKLPDGYKLVFNLYVVEGFSHQEIAEMLQISEGTSKSQLSKAKKYIQNILSRYQILEKEIRYGQ
jgi:RNA polymerase sigma factor (sigma-70 family)